MKKRIEIISALAIIVYILNSFNITSIDMDRKNYNTENNQELYGNVDFKTYIVDFGENKKYLSGVRYKMSSYNETYSAYSNENIESQEYVIEFKNEGNEQNQEILNILSKEQKDTLEQIKTTGDFEKINNGNYVQCNSSYNGISGYYCNLLLPTIFYIEETRVPSGYTKNKVMVPGIITVVYQVVGLNTNSQLLDSNTNHYYRNFFNDDNFIVELRGIHLTNTNGYYMEFGNVDRNELVGLNIEESWKNWKQYATSSTSITGTPYQNGNQQLYLQSVKKNIKLEIESFVNNKTSYTTTKNVNIEYKVSLTNVGNIDAVDSIVTSKLPKGFVYIEGTASNGGEYIDGAIKWRIDKINVGDNLIMTYNAYAPNEIDIWPTRSL